MSQSPLIISLQVKTQILLTTVAGRSSMDRMAETDGHRNGSVYRLRRHRRGCDCESLRVAPRRSVRPVHESASIEIEATMIAISFTLGLRQLPATTTAWHLCTVIIPRRTITGRLVHGQVWRRHDGRHWLYKKFIA